jgi:hypothetical protein
MAETQRQLVKIQVIASFRTQEQLMLEIQMSNSISERDFLKCIFAELTTSELLDLIKFSTCQMVENLDEPFLPFLLTNIGKFYFNPDINEDKETMKYYQWKNDYLVSLLRSPSDLKNEII